MIVESFILLLRSPSTSSSIGGGAAAATNAATVAAAASSFPLLAEEVKFSGAAAGSSSMHTMDNSMTRYNRKKINKRLRCLLRYALTQLSMWTSVFLLLLAQHQLGQPGLKGCWDEVTAAC